jgi:type I restriction-modification system DNA methylase subunit
MIVEGPEDRQPHRHLNKFFHRPQIIPFSLGLSNLPSHTLPLDGGGVGGGEMSLYTFLPKNYNGFNPPMKESLKQITDLVERFERNIEAYHSPAYNETQLRIEFIDPFFEVMGWDVTNKAGYAEQYKDVIHEDAIKIAGATKAPDYCFRIGGVRKFFLETKKPSIDIKTQTSPAYQLRRYAWSAKLPISILTDFEEMAIYDCRLRPKPSEKPSVGRVRFYTYNQYIDSFEEIYNFLSKESVLKGSFDKFAESERQKRGTAEVDEEFLKEIESWREALAKDIALKNPRLTVPELNFAVQLTIDRIIFLRMCEDRGIEKYGQIQNLLNGTNTYRRLREIFYHADDKYNSGLFDFKADRLTPELKLDDKPLKDIFKNLYYPESPYEFSVLGADILGHVYEQFLGKVIRLTEGHRAKVEEKPEVRKAGGVYYTPTYIVEYIVKNTVGKLCDGKTPRQISSLRILDPACGSGSFLLGAYQYLLDYHRDWYQKDGHQKHTKEIYQGRGGQWYLTIQEKKRILLNNIFGVDIDPQAVEVTKLSLLLKVMEGENQDTLERQMKLFKERALPDLGSNIKCGNSLIGPDFYSVGAGLALPLFKEEETYRINPFDWQKEFPEIIRAGGFDVVIGNPPYGASFGDSEKEYIRKNFKSYKYKFDSYIYFIEKAILLCKRKGFISFITPEVWLKLENCAPLRKFISENLSFEVLKICGEKVFAKTIVNTVIFLLHSHVQSKNIRIEMDSDIWQLPSTAWKTSEGLVIDYRFKPEKNELITKIKRSTNRPLSYFGDAIQGITPYDRYRGQTPETIKHRVYHFKYKHDKTCGKWLEGKDISRYKLYWSGEWLSYGPWLAAPRDERFFTGRRLLFREVPGTGKRIQATIVEEVYYHGHSITPFKPNDNNQIDLRYLLGVVNSKLISWYSGLTLPNFGKDIFPKLNPQDIKDLPIYYIDFSDPVDKAHHDKMVALVEQILSLHKQLASAKTPDDKTRLQRQIDATDQQIDSMVYELYRLTKEEIKIVEEDVK